MFQPVVPLAGLAGWVFLQNTFEKQTQAFESAPQIVRDTDYFADEIGKISSAEELVSDRRLLRVALGAFGLQEDLNNRFLIKTVLEEGTGDREALANRLSDSRYAELSAAFGFGDETLPRVVNEGFGREITSQFKQRAFEVAVGTQNDTMRLALNADRELVDLAVSTESEDTRWFQILGTPPLRQVFETALGMPQGFAQLDIDRQLEIFKDRAQSKLGLDSLDSLSDETARDALVRTFVLRDQLNAVTFQSPLSIALNLLQSAN